MKSVRSGVEVFGLCFKNIFRQQYGDKSDLKNMIKADKNYNKYNNKPG